MSFWKKKGMELRSEQALGNLADVLCAEFLYNPISKVTAENFQFIWDHHVEQHGVASEIPNRGSIQTAPNEKPFIDRSGNLRYIDRKTKSCTPLQAYLLEFNFGYTRLK